MGSAEVIFSIESSRRKNGEIKCKEQNVAL
jgi:hypothetical protein